MAKKQLFGTFKDFGKSLTGPSLGPLPTPIDDSVDLDPTWRGFVVVQAGNVTFTGENGHTETRALSHSRKPLRRCISAQATSLHKSGSRM
jgi:hypothetical protein